MAKIFLNFSFFCYETMFQLQPKLLGQLEFCHAVLYRGMNICLICEASLSHHTLCMENLVPAYTMYHVFPCWQKRKIAENREKKNV